MSNKAPNFNSTSIHVRAIVQEKSSSNMCINGYLEKDNLVSLVTNGFTKINTIITIDAGVFKTIDVAIAL